MATIKDVANDCGVSIATVSKAMNNHSDVSDKTKQKIAESVRRLGYHPNSQARFLKTNKTFNIGLIYEDKAHGGLTHQFFSNVLNSFKTEVEQLGYDITFIFSQVAHTPMTFYEHCMFRNVDGVVIVCAEFENDNVQELLHSEIPLVAIDYLQENVCSVVSDNVSGVEEIVDYCVKKGHKKIAFIYGDQSQVTDTRLQTFKDTMYANGIDINPAFIKKSYYHNPEHCEEVVLELLGEETNYTLQSKQSKTDNPLAKIKEQIEVDKPTCIICTDDYAALGAYNAAAALDLKIPQDISIVGYDGIKITQVIKPHITTYKQNAVLIGQRAAFLLARAMKKEEIPVDERVITVKGELLIGKTVANIKV
ncbi:LacI family transcriptional regulator [Clostridia bacterium]|nr:LacI family transcriptional regulator [Clostridia bacterium]